MYVPVNNFSVISGKKLFVTSTRPGGFIICVFILLREVPKSFMEKPGI